MTQDGDPKKWDSPSHLTVSDTATGKSRWTARLERGGKGLKFSPRADRLAFFEPGPDDVKLSLGPGVAMVARPGRVLRVYSETLRRKRRLVTTSIHRATFTRRRDTVASSQTC